MSPGAVNAIVSQFADSKTPIHASLTSILRIYVRQSTGSVLPQQPVRYTTSHMYGHTGRSEAGPAMIERYSRPQMAAVWSERRKIDAWLAVEVAVADAWHQRGRVPADAIARIRTASCDLDRMREIERETDHDVIAFVRATGETVGDAARFIHLGLTSSDVVDTGLGIQIAEAAALLGAGLDQLISAVGNQALLHKNTLTIGRTHGIHAEPTTFGLKLAVWFDELRRHRIRLDLARYDMAVGKVSGAVGTHAHVPPDLENEVCDAVGLRAAPVSTQVIQRDRHAFFLAVIAGIGGTLEKMTVEIRHLQRTEVREVEEPFDTGNQGSSAMPHKRNPHQSERISGLARLLRGYAQTASENVALWHERDISHSSVERVIFPDACMVLDFMMHEITGLVERWTVRPDQMMVNLDLTGGLIYSQRVMLALVDHGMDRQDAYRLIQHIAHTAWDGDTSFRQAVSEDITVTALIDKAEMATLFDPTDQLRHVDAIFQRLDLAGSRGDVPSPAEGTG